MEEEDIVRSAQAIAASMRFSGIYLATVLLVWGAIRLHVVPLQPTSRLGWCTLWVTLLPVSLVVAVALDRLSSHRS